MKTHQSKTSLLFAHHPITPFILQQLLFFNNYRHVAATILHPPIVICKFERRPTTAYKPLVVSTYYLQHLQTLCGCCLPLVSMLPSLKISCLLPYCCFPIVATIMWQRVLSTLEIKTKKRIFYCSCQRNEKLSHKT